jgi:hypothetical protein
VFSVISLPEKRCLPWFNILPCVLVALGTEPGGHTAEFRTYSRISDMACHKSDTRQTIDHGRGNKEHMIKKATWQ